jgi:membrane-bound metal-dependent hydrolase YbcI (DUF457 family)
MADFRTHVTFSSILGAGYGTLAYTGFDMPLSTCLLAGGLCGVSGMLPDLDSDSGIPLRESIAFAAAIVPMMLVDRLEYLGLDNESIVLIGAGLYLFIRFGFAAFLKQFTVHRGMFHSLPAALIFAELAFLLASGDLAMRSFKAGGVLLGFLSHLLLDEVWSVRMTYTGPRLKKSFGTAFKLWGNNLWANCSTYLKLAACTFLVFNDPIWIESPEQQQQQQATIATSVFEEIWK